MMMMMMMIIIIIIINTTIIPHLFPLFCIFLLICPSLTTFVLFIVNIFVP